MEMVLKKNEEKAFRLYLNSAEKGNFKSLTQLINLSLEGNPLCQFYLGNFYENGIGIKKNISESLKYYKLSIQNGYFKSKEYYNNLSKNKIYHILDFEELESFLMNYEMNFEIPLTILNLIENNYIFLIENIFIYLNIRSNNFLILINFILNLSKIIKNLQLFKDLLIIF